MGMNKASYAHIYLLFAIFVGGHQEQLVYNCIRYSLVIVYIYTPIQIIVGLWSYIYSSKNSSRITMIMMNDSSDRKNVPRILLEGGMYPSSAHYTRRTLQYTYWHN